jgi:hypothetical protein
MIQIVTRSIKYKGKSNPIMREDIDFDLTPKNCAT